MSSAEYALAILRKHTAHYLREMSRLVPASHWRKFTIEKTETSAAYSPGNFRDIVHAYFITLIQSPDELHHECCRELAQWQPLIDLQEEFATKRRGKHMSYEPESLLGLVVIEYLRLQQNFSFEESQFNTIAHELLNCIIAKTSRMRLWMIVRRLQLDGDQPSALGGAFVLRKMSSDEVFQHCNDIGAPILADGILENHWIIECTRDERIVQESDGALPVEFLQFATAFREAIAVVSGKEPICATLHLEPCNRGGLIQNAHSIGADSSNIPAFMPPDINLNKDELETVLILLRALLTDKSMPKFVGIAVKRLGFSARRSTPEDRIVDLVVALESIFGDTSPGGGNLAYKVAVRAAFYLRKEPLEREALFKRVNKAYAARSRVAHGGELDQGDLSQVVSDASSISKEVLLKIIRNRAVSGAWESQENIQRCLWS
jgi:hypothetical protein